MESVRIGSKMVDNIVGEAGKRKLVAKINRKSGSAVKQCGHNGCNKRFLPLHNVFSRQYQSRFPEEENATRKAFYYWPFPKKKKLLVCRLLIFVAKLPQLP